MLVVTGARCPLTQPAVAAVEQQAATGAGARGPGWCSPGSWPHRGRPRRTTPYQLSRQTLWQFDLRNRKLQTVSQIVTEVQLCDTHIEYIPEVTEHPHDYNTTTENEILDSKISASANINDPTPTPDPMARCASTRSSTRETLRYTPPRPSYPKRFTIP